MNDSARADDSARVTALLGREPRGAYEVVVRDAQGDPVVLRNAPLLDDGTPMPTLYWLISPDEIRRVGQLESIGGVDEAEAAVDPAVLASAHDRYAAERDADIPADHTGPRPSGGVGGTRVGVKCLHAHWAWHLAGGDDPIGRWIDDRLHRPHLEIGDAAMSFTIGGEVDAAIPWGARTLTERWLLEHDPPRPEALTNALGTIDDHLDDVVREYARAQRLDALTVTGPMARALAQLEVGVDDVDDTVELTRGSAEEIFRMVATESAADRADQPGLPSEAVDLIIATCCIVLTFMRRYHLDAVILQTTLTP